MTEVCKADFRMLHFQEDPDFTVINGVSKARILLYEKNGLNTIPPIFVSEV